MLSFVDLFLIIILAWFTYKGFMNGLVIEITSLLALIAGAYIAIHFSQLIGGKLGLEGNTMALVAFVITFIGVVVLVHIIGKAVEKGVKVASLGIINKIAGAFFGMLKVALIISILIYMLDTIDTKHYIIGEKTRKQSVLFNPVKKLAPTILPSLRQDSDKKKD